MYFGRSWADSPDIDGQVLFTGDAREGELRICESFFWRVAFRDSGVGCAPGPVFRCRAVGIAEEDIRQGRCAEGPGKAEKVRLLTGAKAPDSPGKAGK